MSEQRRRTELSPVFHVRREDLRPEVRSYTDNLCGQLVTLLREQKAVTLDDLEFKFRYAIAKGATNKHEATIVLEKAKLLLAQLRETISNNELPEAAFRKEFSERAARDLSVRLTSRAKELSHPDLKFSLTPPEIPEGWTRAHVDALKDLFFGNLLPMVLPKSEDVYQLDESYLDVMYPLADEARQKRDRQLHSGLVTCFKEPDYRPDKYLKQSRLLFSTAIKDQLDEMGGVMMLLESTPLPNTGGGGSFYGTNFNDTPFADPFSEIFEQVLGRQDRFNWSQKTITEKLLPVLHRRIEFFFGQRFLSVPPFEVAIQPAFAANVRLTLYQPADSDSFASEHTSTFMQPAGAAEMVVLHAGSRFNGGAAGVGKISENSRWVQRGVRFVVYMKERDT